MIEMEKMYTSNEMETLIKFSNENEECKSAVYSAIKSKNLYFVKDFRLEQRLKYRFDFRLCEWAETIQLVENGYWVDIDEITEHPLLNDAGEITLDDFIQAYVRNDLRIITTYEYSCGDGRKPEELESFIYEVLETEKVANQREILDIHGVSKEKAREIMTQIDDLKQIQKKLCKKILVSFYCHNGDYKFSYNIVHEKTNPEWTAASRAQKYLHDEKIYTQTTGIPIPEGAEVISKDKSLFKLIYGGELINDICGERAFLFNEDVLRDAINTDIVKLHGYRSLSSRLDDDETT